MPLFNMDIGDMPTFEPVAEGDYEASVVSAEEATSKKGDPMIVLSFGITDSDPDINGRQLRYWHMLPNNPKDENYRFRLQLTRALCEALGLEGNPEITDFIGASAQITVKHEEYEGTLRDQIARVSAL